MRAALRRSGGRLVILAIALALGPGVGLESPAFAQTVTCAEIGGTCRTQEEGPAGGEVLDNSGSCAFEGGPIKKCYAPKICDERGGACQPSVSSCSSGTTQLGNGQCSSGRCCTPPTSGPTCGELLGHTNGFCSPYSDTCPAGYENRGPTVGPCMSCCELSAGPTPTPTPTPTGGGAPYKVEYLHTDALGSVRMVTDQTGVVVSRRDYYPFGAEIDGTENGRAAIDEYSVDPNARERFTGKKRDAESSLDYFGARYYSASMGRFTSVDPAMDVKSIFGAPQGWNRYSYADNNPLSNIDRDGRQSEPANYAYSLTALYNAGKINEKQLKEGIAASARGEQSGAAAGIATAAGGWVAANARALWAAGVTYFFGTNPNAGPQLLGAVGEVLTGTQMPASPVGAATSAAGKVGEFVDVKFIGQLERQLTKDGSKSVFKTLRSLETRLAEHEAKLGGLEFKSSVEREIRVFKSQIEAAKAFIKERELQ